MIATTQYNKVMARSAWILLILASYESHLVSVLAFNPTPIQPVSVSSSLSLSSETTTSSLGDTQTTKSSVKEKAVVVGAGPGGLASALILSNLSYDVTILEKTAPSNFSEDGTTDNNEGQESMPTQPLKQFDIRKAFSYLIDWRGQEFTIKFPAIHRKIQERSVPSSTMLVTRIPGDPNKPIPTPVIAMAGGVEKRDSDSYWIPRNELIAIFLEEIEERNKDNVTDQGRIHIVMGSDVKQVRIIDSQENANNIEVNNENRHSLVEVTSNVFDGEKENTYEAKIVIGADGFNSNVRSRLSQIDGGKFGVKRYKSPAAGLRYKVLQMPYGVNVPNITGTVPLTMRGDSLYSFLSVNKGAKNEVRMGCLPLKDPKSLRSTNIITKPNHAIWDITDGEEMRKWMHKSFPRMSFQHESEGGIISSAEWSRFASAKGGAFPSPGVSLNMQLSSKDETCGVALVGDAVHVFPPDLGQGVNSALQDVLVLNQTIIRNGSSQDKSTKLTLGLALKQYERDRLPEAKALVKLNSHVGPYQYKQTGLVDTTKAKLKVLNILFKVVLNKITFGIFPLPAAMMFFSGEAMSYRTIKNRSDAGTYSIVSLLAVFALRKLMKLR
mmetsp:Transcript_10899/g.13351  ORF Transcript_10899/g.13351 Transcript_10899/m.13351 type:complete len:609 (+) Transcript_10899:66-1892(+)